MFCSTLNVSGILPQANTGFPATHHRRVACSFRDQCLFQIFQISLTSLHQLKNDGMKLQYCTHPNILPLIFFYLFGYCYFEVWVYIMSSSQSIARAGTFSFFEMSILWFCGDICWWKFRWVWHCSGIFFYLILNLIYFGGDLIPVCINYHVIWLPADSISLEVCSGGHYDSANIFWLLCHYEGTSFKGGL